MIADNAPANPIFLWNVDCGDTSKRRAEHGGFLHLKLTHTIV